MKFEENYYLNSQTSNYINYTQKKFGDLYKDLVSIPIPKETSILDFGCATGGLVSCFYKDGYNIIGTDVSYWAIKYGRKQYDLPATVLHHYNRQLLEEDRDLVLFLDVLEHIPTDELEEILDLSKNIKSAIIRIPVSKIEGEDFILNVSRNDKTHIQIHCKEWWLSLLNKHGFVDSIPINKKSIYESDGVLSRLFRGHGWKRFV